MNEVMHRQELERGDTQLRQIGDRCRVGECRVCPANLFGDPGQPGGKALDVRLVDQHLVQRPPDGRSSPQSKRGSMTIERGTNGALSSLLISSGSSALT